MPTLEQAYELIMFSSMDVQGIDSNTFFQVFWLGYIEQ